MIATDAGAGFATLLLALERRAASLAEARTISARMERDGDDRRWRRPELLWPRFAKGR